MSNTIYLKWKAFGGILEARTAASWPLLFFHSQKDAKTNYINVSVIVCAGMSCASVICECDAFLSRCIHAYTQESLHLNITICIKTANRHRWL